MSNVSSGAVMTLVVPLSLLALVCILWAITQRQRLRRAPGHHKADEHVPEVPPPPRP